ncbi:putative E3 ubiquitin-protein ligase XBAT31 [Platanthera guangdongensis]|uniref:RING-type E3 ubiquitin transferase n=1 Tax=Platanthera guangdongensis TaxID=2320717 RepID=A0ABR2LVW5_9ASPA
MGQGMSCGHPNIELDFFAAVQYGELMMVESILRMDPGILRRTTSYGRLSALHIAAARGHVEMLSMLLERWDHPDVLNRHKQTPLMVAAMRGKISCVEKLLQAGANILTFDSANGRTCLHYAAYYGHSDCLQAIIQAAQSNPISESWGFARFVNVRDAKGATPLHLAAKKSRPTCVRMLLDNGALVCVSTGDYGSPGSTPLHLAARGGCLDSVRELLAWGADRLQMDSAGRIPYVVALKRNHICAALLNPSSAEPLVWPSPLKFISELNPDVKLLLETALIDANKKREKKIFKGMPSSYISPDHSEENVGDDDKSEGSDVELCCICFEQVCTIEVRDCGHQMCAYCTLALCSHNKPNRGTLSPPAPPLCPFCRSTITRLAAAKTEISEDVDKETSPKLRRSRHSASPSEGSSSFKGLSMGSFGRMGAHGSGRIADSSSLILDKP